MGKYMHVAAEALPASLYYKYLILPTSQIMFLFFRLLIIYPYVSFFCKLAYVNVVSAKLDRITNSIKQDSTCFIKHPLTDLCSY